MTILKERLIYEEEVLKEDNAFSQNENLDSLNVDSQYSLLDSHANNLMSSIENSSNVQLSDQDFLNYLDNSLGSNVDIV